MVEAVIAPGKRADYETIFDEYLALRAQRPGAGRAIAIDAGEDRALVVFCWESAAHSADGHDAALIAAAQRLFPALVEPQTVLGGGDVGHDTYTAGAGYGVLVEVVVAPAEQDAFQEAFQAFRAVRARQAGFRGTIEIEAGEGQLFLLVLWGQAEDRALAAQQPAMQQGWPRVVATLGTAPKFIGSGAVGRDTAKLPAG